MTSPLDLAFLGLHHYPVRKKEKISVTCRVIMVWNYIFYYFYFTIANHGLGRMCMLMVISSITPTVVNLTFDPLSPRNPGGPCRANTNTTEVRKTGAAVKR